MMGISGLQIGDILGVFCSRCSLNLDASVSAFVDGKVVKVTCRTCGNEVKYRPPRDEKAHKKKQLDRLMRRHESKLAERGQIKTEQPAARSGGGNELRALWDELTDKVDARYARVYDETRTYIVEDALLHKQLGMGIVHAIHADGEMQVLFRTGFHPLPSGVAPDEDDD